MAINNNDIKNVMKRCDFINDDTKKGTTEDLKKLPKFTIKEFYEVKKDDKDNTHYFLFTIEEQENVVFSTGGFLTKLFSEYQNEIIGTVFKHDHTEVFNHRNYEVYSIVE